MFKQLAALFLIILCISIANAANTTCAPCPSPTPYIVYVTVTVPVPVTATPTMAPIVQPTLINPPPMPTDSNLITQITNNKEYLIYAGLFMFLIIGIIMMKKKQKKLIKTPTQKPIELVNDKYGNLYEEEEVEIQPVKKEEPKPIKKPKKPKKPKSLLDQDFEF